MRESESVTTPVTEARLAVSAVPARSRRVGSARGPARIPTSTTTTAAIAAPGNAGHA
ncbi:hypothetical protein BC477_09965 [Clavibacter michiganensis subsp. michiganensis]|uniref:Uncharacterized protein n=1 Tax=Clavibacter michiganensis subsp. michiganensis TaxID=33013 RepID=A0A251XNH7_CLAMM|nr:hypothetical protein BC477_09965 [Clavibacter michiganensis subsp. michiganensis]OUE05052.1 hypothetical protein CMMCAS07_08885 [Clavibacter michiganensis subsp. michiganensis]